MTAHISYKSLPNPIANCKMADKMAAVQGKVTAFIGLTKKSLDGASDSLDGDREIIRRLIGRHNMMTRLWWTASATQLLLQGYGVYISFQVLQHIAFRGMPASMLVFLVSGSFASAADYPFSSCEILTKMSDNKQPGTDSQKRQSDKTQKRRSLRRGRKLLEFFTAPITKFWLHAVSWFNVCSKSLKWHKITACNLEPPNRLTYVIGRDFCKQDSRWITNFVRYHRSALQSSC